MTTPIRDTQFGHLTRYLSGNTLLQYPDETDPSLYLTAVSSKTERLQCESSDPSNDLAGLHEADIEEPNTATYNIVNTELIDVGKVGEVCHGIDGQASFLVDWYGPDDPEVLPLFGIRSHIADIPFRIHETGPATGKS